MKEAKPKMRKNKPKLIKAISLFCSGGIGDLALRENGIEVIVANELLSERASIFEHNFPNAEMIVGDIWEKKEEIILTTKRILNGQGLDFALATPPCQGMSKNGQGKLLNGIRAGKKAKVDYRNRLIIPTMRIMKELRPKTIVFENVPEMSGTIIDDENGDDVNIIDYIKRSLGSDYIGQAEVVGFADFGIPQRRKRLITVFTRDKKLISIMKSKNSFIPDKTHSQSGGDGLKRWVTVRDVISDLPQLDGVDEESATSNIPFHKVPVLDPKKYIWISSTPPERGAFNNQCINEKCRYEGNPTHGSEHNSEGINRAKSTTPLYCLKCKALLPRPFVIRNGEKQLMTGYTSAYKRMCWDLPSPTLTTNLSYPSSDHKIHPDQNRVLSLHEAFKLHTLDKYNYEWQLKDDKPANDTTIAEIIGESIPPKALSVVIQYLLDLGQEKRLPLFASQSCLVY